MVEEVLMHKGGNILSPFKINETFFYVGRMISRQVLFKKGRNDFLSHWTKRILFIIYLIVIAEAYYTTLYSEPKNPPQYQTIKASAFTVDQLR